MEYQQVLPAVFIERPNRFVALCMLEGHPVTAHVKNTGRCRELLTPGAAVFLQHQPAPGRKTQYTLTHVQKGKRLVHIDSQAPNRLVEEALRASRLSLPGRRRPQVIRPETFYGESRFDFYLEEGEKRAFAEVKGVTLEENGWARFPDAPTERGVKHLQHLARAAEEGYLCYVVFAESRAFRRTGKPIPLSARLCCRQRRLAWFRWRLSARCCRSGYNWPGR